jgi:hypothetical protein
MSFTVNQARQRIKALGNLYRPNKALSQSLCTLSCKQCVFDPESTCLAPEPPYLDAAAPHYAAKVKTSPRQCHSAAGAKETDESGIRTHALVWFTSEGVPDTPLFGEVFRGFKTADPGKKSEAITNLSTSL